jgi:3-oxoacyl-[acyl-carrier-protein] synthase II
LITSVGAGRTANFAAFCEQVSGNKPLQCFDQQRFRFTRAYEIADRRPGMPDVKGRATEWLRRCVIAAMDEANFVPRGERVALLVGTGLRELRGLELWWTDQVPFHVSELHFGGALQRDIAGLGPVFTFSNACAASNFALGLGADLLKLKEADVVIIAGCDSITESMYGALDRVTAAPPEQVRPFNQDRKGVLLGEGAAAVLLEPLEQATARGATPLALLRGVGMSCDAHHETAPAQDGIAFAMQDAQQRAAVAPADIDLLIAHGTGTPLNDSVEALAIKQVFGTVATEVPISALKSMTGHTSGSSGLMGVVVGIEAMRQGRIPPTLGFSQPMPEAEGLNIVHTTTEASVDIVQVNAFGFGGVNAVVVLERGAS